MLKVRRRFLDTVRKGWVRFWKECGSLATSCSCKVIWVCKTVTMDGVLWTHKTSNLMLSFRVLDVLQTFLLNWFGRTHQHFYSLPTKIPRSFEQSISSCIEDLPILPFFFFLFCRKYSLGDKDDIRMNRLEGSLPSLYNLFSVCRFTGTFMSRQSIGIHFELFIRGRTEPLYSPPTNTDS